MIVNGTYNGTLGSILNDLAKQCHAKMQIIIGIWGKVKRYLWRLRTTGPQSQRRAAWKLLHPPKMRSRKQYHRNVIGDNESVTFFMFGG